MFLLKTILCFGDSNTYGESPEGFGRYPREERWTGILQRSLGSGYTVIEEGLNGRTTVWEDPVEGDKCGIRHLPSCIASHTPLDLVIIMLGSNDLKQRFHATPADIALGMERLVRTARSIDNYTAAAPFEVLLVSPPSLRETTFLGEVFGDRRADSLRVGALARQAAERCGAAFLDMAQYTEPSALDGLHLDRNNHKLAAEVLARKIKEILSDTVEEASH